MTSHHDFLQCILTQLVSFIPAHITNTVISHSTEKHISYKPPTNSIVFSFDLCNLGEHITDVHFDANAADINSGLKIELLGYGRDSAELKITESIKIRNLKPTINPRAAGGGIKLPPFTF